MKMKMKKENAMTTQTKTNSWRLNRAGLINFWYYDQQEFEFAEGRMLLRGSNGSGKSVTMQSFIPLLLDGNRSPERLDPFGSKSRKLDNYMLDDQDAQDERVGYLYLSFKQTDVDLYQTIGMGIRARKHMPLETWYFQLNNNKRINDNFSLYRNQNQTNVLTKSELKQAIGEDGQLFDTQREYTEAVNQVLFGFESVDEYKELINLLIQLRSPKLSKDFKPTVISEILTQSLQPLTDEDLRPLSESIENMDGIETNLASLRMVQTSLNRLSQAFIHYNSAVFREETKKLEAEIGDLNQQLTLLIQSSERITTGQHDLLNLQQELAELEAEQEVVEKKIEDLQHHDVVSLKERQERLLQEIGAERNYRILKQEQIEKKEADILRLNTSLRDKQQEQAMLKRQINQLLLEMDALASDFSFDEHDFFKTELLEQFNKPFKFALTNDALKKFKQLLHQTKDALHATEIHQRDYERLLQEQDQLMAERNQLERSERDYLNQVTEIKAEWQNQFMQWIQHNRVFQLDGNCQEAIYHLVQRSKNTYEDLPTVQTKIAQVQTDITQTLSAKLIKSEHEQSQLIEQINEKQMLYSEWFDRQDPEPVRSIASQKARQYLKSQKIPFAPFYQTLDFQEGLSEELINRLEELLLETKLLDALVIPKSYKEEVLTFQLGQQETYLFVDYPGQLKTLNLYLVDAISEDHLSGWDKGKLKGQLEAMFHGETNNSQAIAIEPVKGQFKLGPLYGTISGEYEAKFIGVSRRARYRENMLSQIQQEIDGLEAKELAVQHQISHLKNDLQQLINEANRFPDFEDLRLAFREHDSLVLKLEQNQGKLTQLEASLATAKQIFEKFRSESQQLCRRLNISESIEAAHELISLSEEYTEQFSSLKQDHQRYVAIIEQTQTLEENIDHSDLELSDFIGELTRFEHKINVLEQDLESVIEHLKTSDYDEIRQLLDEALSKRKSLPHEINTIREQSVRLDQQLITYQEAIKALHQHVQSSRQTIKDTYHGYIDEVKLAYVYDEDNLRFQMELDDLWQRYLGTDYAEATEQVCEALKQLIKRLESELTTVKRNRRYKMHEVAAKDSLHSLQQEFILQQNQLSHYAPQMKAFYGKLAPDYSRMDIQAKLQGRNVSLFELNDSIESQVEVNQHLLQKEDRELFEEIITNTIGRKIRARIYLSENWVKEMNALMSQAEQKTSNGFMLSLKWKYKESQQEGELSSRELINLLKKDSALMTDFDRDKLTLHFRNKIKQARELLSESNHTYTFHTMLREVLDYRQWFEFQLLFKKAGEKMVELTNNKFFALSGGEKAMAMYVPLFSAVVAKYRGARPDAPRIISLDEAFAGIDELNIREMFRYMIQFNFNFIINSQILWGDYDTVPRMRIYQLLRPQNAKFVTVIPYLWDGSKRITEVNPLDLIEEP